MSELKTRPSTAPVAEFLAQQSSERRADCEAVLRMMEAATGERAEMWGAAIVGFGRYAYTNSARKTFEWPIVGFSPRKDDLTLYIMPGFDGFAGLMAKLGKHKKGKSCLYLKKLADVDATVLRALIEESVKAMEPQRVR
ncbi:MAG: DUF1801 domain-containing protein [Pseudomonadota bacterium]